MNTNNSGYRNIVVFSLLAIVLLGAFALRFKGITFGLPLTTHTDEVIIMRTVSTMIKNADANPHFFNYPSFYLYLQVLIRGAVDVYGKVSGAYSGLQAADQSTIYLAGRFLTLLLSMGTILTVYFIGKLLFTPYTGVTAALILAVCSLHVTNSVFITVDSPMTFWVMLTFLQAALIYQRGPKWRFYILGALFAGFAVGTKYTAFIVLLPLFYAHLHAHFFSWKALFHKKLLLAALLVALAFLVTTPYALLDFQHFSQAAQFESSHYARGHMGAAADTVSYPQYASLLQQGFGQLLLFIALSAAAYLAITNWRKGLLLLLFPILLFLFIGMYRTYFSRNLLSLSPFLALAAAYLAVASISFLQQTIKQAGLSRKWLAVSACGVVIVLTCGGILQQGLYSFKYISDTILPDIRLEAGMWIRENLPRGARIACEKYTPRLDRNWFNVRNFGFKGSLKNEPQLSRFDYIISSSYNYMRYFNNEKKYGDYIALYKRIFNRYKCIKIFVPDHINNTGPTLKILQVQ